MANCRVKIVRMPAGGTLRALVAAFDPGVTPANRRHEFVTKTDENGVYVFEAIPVGPYKLHWQPQNDSGWIRRIRNKPDIIVEQGRAVHCDDVEANIRALN